MLVARDETTVKPAKLVLPTRATDRIVLEVLNGPQRGDVFELSRSPMVVGKGDVDISLQVTGVSRSHAKLVRAADGTVSLLDLASTNGTLVNGTPVDLATLHDGDRVQFGPEVVLRVGFARRQAGPDAKELSSRQLEVARLVARGGTNAAIAAELGISPRTVSSHLDAIYMRLEVSSRAALTRWIFESGLD